MWFDLIVVALLLFCMVRGAKKGFLWQLATIAAVALCFLFAETASVAIAPYLKLDPPLNRWVSMLLLYVACSFVCFAVARGMQSGLEKAKFEAYDRHLGGLFGLIKGAGIAVILTFFAVTLSERLRPTVLSSYSGHASAVVMDALSPVFPQELGNVLEPHLRKFQGFEEEFRDARLADGEEDVENLFGDDPGGDGLFVDDFGDGPLAGGSGMEDGGFGDDPFGWGEPGGDRVPSRPVSGDGAFGDSDPTFGETPGQGDAWFRDGEFNAGRLRDEAGEIAGDLWDDVPEETKRGLTDSLRDSAANELKRRAEDGLGFRLDGFLGDPNADPGVADPPRTGPTRQELISEIAAVYNKDETIQATLKRRFAQALGPVPEEASIAILRDWLYDLRQPDGVVDPDPGTNLATTLPERISREMRRRTASSGGGANRQ
ncbi:MAG: CvpA family protein [Planctomycetota bacterium]